MDVQRRLRVFENKVLKRVFGSKKGETTEGWRKLDNNKLHPSLVIIMVINQRE